MHEYTHNSVANKLKSTETEQENVRCLCTPKCEKKVLKWH